MDLDQTAQIMIAIGIFLCIFFPVMFIRNFKVLDFRVHLICGCYKQFAGTIKSDVSSTWPSGNTMIWEIWKPLTVKVWFKGDERVKMQKAYDCVTREETKKYYANLIKGLK